VSGSTSGNCSYPLHEARDLHGPTTGPYRLPKTKRTKCEVDLVFINELIVVKLGASITEVTLARRRGRWEKGHQCLSPDLDKVFKLALASTLFLRDQINWMTSTPSSG
jgi:hypothetical protein